MLSACMCAWAHVFFTLLDVALAVWALFVAVRAGATFLRAVAKKRRSGTKTGQQ
jgi:hypothetical protein